MTGASAATGLAMRAAIVAGARRMRLERVDAPVPGPGEARVRLQGCGVCGSNLPVWEGRPWFSYPLPPGAPGHEGWGSVDALGPGVHGVRVGQRVCLLSERAFAEYDLAPADTLVAIPDSLEGEPVPGEALACAWNVFARSRIGPGQRVAVVGMGFLGGMVLQLAVRAGARVAALSRRPFALRLAESLGADAVFPLVPERARSVDAVSEWSGGELCEVSVEATGLEEPLALAAELTRIRGRLVIAGYHQDGPRLVDMQLWNWRGLDVINAHERDRRSYVEGMRAAVEAVSAGRLDPRPLYTHRYALSELDVALEAARSRPDGFLKALVLT